MTRYNFSAKTLEDAITKATVELGVTSDRLDYVVTEQGSNGVFGIGARPWVISACSKEEIEKEQEEAARAAEQEAAKTSQLKAATSQPQASTSQPKAEMQEGRQPKAASAKPQATTSAQQQATTSSQPQTTSSSQPHPTSQPKAEMPENQPKADAGEAAAKAETFLRNVFESMGMEVAMKSEYDPMLGELTIDLSGDDMGVLIGKRGQTLDSLQYLAGQVVNKHSSDYVRVKLDTENYRERRKEALETLAHNMAHKVRRTKHAMALEPMNPYERRIIHSTLQDEKDIITRSEGEEPYRHVVVCFVKHKK